MAVKCPVCAEMFDEDALHQHLVEAHSQTSVNGAASAGLGVLSPASTPHRCVFCRQVFDTPELLKAHHLSAHQK